MADASVAFRSTRAHPFAGERPVTPEVVREHNLNELEYGRILEMLGRTPTLTELCGLPTPKSVEGRNTAPTSIRSPFSAPSRPPARSSSRDRVKTPAC